MVSRKPKPGVKAICVLAEHSPQPAPAVQHTRKLETRCCWPYFGCCLSGAPHTCGRSARLAGAVHHPAVLGARNSSMYVGDLSLPEMQKAVDEVDAVGRPSLAAADLTTYPIHPAPLPLLLSFPPRRKASSLTRMSCCSPPSLLVYGPGLDAPHFLPESSCSLNDGRESRSSLAGPQWRLDGDCPCEIALA